MIFNFNPSLSTERWKHNILNSKFSYLKVQALHISKVTTPELSSLDNSLICIMPECRESVTETDNWTVIVHKIIRNSHYLVGSGEINAVMLMYVFINPISIKKDVSIFFVAAVVWKWFIARRARMDWGLGDVEIVILLQHHPSAVVHLQQVKTSSKKGRIK